MSVTVRELRERLADFPADARVMILTTGQDYKMETTEDIEASDDGQEVWIDLS